jgi:hypothetical protein
MKQTLLLIASFAMLLFYSGCKNQENNNTVTTALSDSDVSVYYFHFTNRCATCLAVEENSKKAVEELYPNEVKTGDYSFTSLNLDDKVNKSLADKLGVGGQALVIVRKDKKIDLTSDGFLNAHDPAKMKEILKSGVEKVLF